MKKAVFVFRNKTEVFRLIDELNAYGVRAGTTGTPKEAKIGCGIAVETELSKLMLAKRIISSGNYQGYYGAFTIERVGGRTITARV